MASQQAPSLLAPQLPPVAASGTVYPHAAWRTPHFWRCLLGHHPWHRRLHDRLKPRPERPLLHPLRYTHLGGHYCVSCARLHAASKTFVASSLASVVSSACPATHEGKATAPQYELAKAASVPAPPLNRVCNVCTDFPPVAQPRLSLHTYTHMLHPTSRCHHAIPQAAFACSLATFTLHPARKLPGSYTCMYMHERHGGWAASSFWAVKLPLFSCKLVTRSRHFQTWKTL